MAAIPQAHNLDSLKEAILSALSIQRKGLTYDALAAEVGKFIKMDLKNNMALKTQFDQALRDLVNSRKVKQSGSLYTTA